MSCRGKRNRSSKKSRRHRRANSLPVRTAALSTERREHFEQILAQLVTAIAPTDAIVQMWVYDIAVLVWEMMRLRRYKAMFVESWMPLFIRSTAREFIGDDESYQSEDFADSYFRDSEQRQRLVDALATSNLNTDWIDAQAFRRASTT